MTNEVETEEIPDTARLILTLVEAQNRDRAYTTNSLCASYEREIRKLEATLDAIVDRVYGLCSKDYAPSTSAILKALSPSSELIKFYEERSERKFPFLENEDH